MPEQTIQVPIPRSALSAEDFGLDDKGNLKLDKGRLNQIVRENIGRDVDERAAVSVGVVVSF